MRFAADADLPAPHLVRVAAGVQAALDAAGIQVCLIGGMVIPRWGQPRTTTDADFSALAPYGEEGSVLDVLLARFEARHAGEREFALRHRVVRLSDGGVGIDVALAAYAFEIEALDRATPWPLGGGVALRTCSAEHLIVYKLVAARPQDLIDVAGIVKRQGTRLDVGLIRRWGREFAELKEDPDLLRPFEDCWLEAQK